MISEYSKPYYKVKDVSHYIIGKCISDNSPITNLQLQRMLYFIQREFFELEVILFEEDFEAWGFGPCIPNVYYEYCGYGGMQIRTQYDTSKIDLIKEFRVVIDHLITKYRTMTDWDQIEDICSKEGAWYAIYNKPVPKWKRYVTRHNIIPKELIQEKG